MEYGALAVGVIFIAISTIYAAIKSWRFTLFLAGAFFTSAGLLAYLWFIQLSVPIVGTDLVQSPTVSGARSIGHVLLCGVCAVSGMRRSYHKRLDQR